MLVVEVGAISDCAEQCHPFIFTQQEEIVIFQPSRKQSHSTTNALPRLMSSAVAAKTWSAGYRGGSGAVWSALSLQKVVGG